MSDYFLNKIYDSLLSNKSIPKKPILIKENKDSKKPNTLQQAYRLTLTRINEDTEIVMQGIKNGVPHGDVYSSVISDDVANKIKNEIKQKQEYTISGKKFNITNELKKILDLKGWKGKFDVSKEVVSIFAEEEINIEEFVKYFDYVNNKDNNLIREKLLNTPQKLCNFLELIPEWFNNLFQSKNGTDVANKLWYIKLSVTPAIGNGEVVLTLLSDGIKEKIGDLYFKDYGKLEVKGINGSMGGDGYTNKHTTQELNKILAKENHISEVTLNRIKNEILSALEVKKQERIRTKGAQEQNIKSIEQFISSIKQEIYNDNNLEELKQTIKLVPNKELQTTLFAKLKKYEKYQKGTTIKTGFYRDSLISFFGMYKQLTTEQIVKGVFAARNYSSVIDAESIKKAIETIVTGEGFLFNENGLSRQLEYLIGALHAALYQKQDEFKGILFLNDNNKKMVLFNFDSNNVADNLEKFYYFLNDFSPVISLSMSEKVQQSASFKFF